MFYIPQTILFIMLFRWNLGEVHIGVLLQTADVSHSMIKKAEEYVNSGAYPPLGGGFKVFVKTLNTNSSTEISEEVCNFPSSKLIGLVAMANCRTLKLLRSQLASLSRPLLALPTDPCEISGGPFSLSLRASGFYMNEAVIDIIHRQRWKEVVLFYDAETGYDHVNRLLTLMSSSSKPLVRAVTYYVDKILRDPSLLSRHDTHPSRYFILICGRRHLELVLKLAKEQGLLTPFHYWIVSSPDLTHKDFDAGFLQSSNVVVIEKAIKYTKDAPLQSDVSRYFAVCGDNITIDSSFVVDGIIALADAISTVLRTKRHNMTMIPDLLCERPSVEAKQETESIMTALRQIRFKGMMDVGFTSDGRSNDTNYDIYGTYSTDDKTIFKKVGSWVKASRLNLTQRSPFPNSFFGFGRQVLTVVTTESKPFVIMEDGGNGTINYKGFVIDILNEMAKMLNFRYRLVNPPDGQYGAINPDGTWNGMVGMVLRKEVDFAVGAFSITSARDTVVDFTKPYLSDGAGIIIRKPDDSDAGVFKVFLPLDVYVWVAVVVTILVTGVSTFIASYYSPLSGYNSTREVLVKDEVSCPENLWSSFGMYMEQGGTMEPKAYSTRIMYAALWISVIVVTSIYMANLTASLTVNVIDLPIRSISDLAQHNNIKPIVKRGTSLYQLFKGADSGTYKDIGDKLDDKELVGSNDEGIQKVLNGPFAYMNDRTQLEYIVSMECDKYSLIPESFYISGMGFVVQENIAYRDDFSDAIIKMQESGLVERWRKKWWPSDGKCTANTPTKKPLDIDSFSGSYLLIGVSFGTALLVLLGELAFERIKKLKNIYALKDKK